MNARAQRIEVVDETCVVREAARAEGLAALSGYRTFADNLTFAQTQQIVDTHGCEGVGRAGDLPSRED